MGSPAKPVLFAFYKSSCSYRVRIALALKGIKYEIVPINLMKNEQLNQKYLDINQTNLVPSLQIDNYTFSGSLAIMEYLNETRPDPPLLPADPRSRAIVRQMSGLIASEIQPIQNLRVMKKIEKFGESKLEWAKYWITEGFTGLEKWMKQNSGKYCFGNTVTMAVCCLVPQVYNAINRYEVDMEMFPTIKAVSDNLDQLEAVKVAHPSEQPDFPGK